MGDKNKGDRNKGDKTNGVNPVFEEEEEEEKLDLQIDDQVVKPEDNEEDDFMIPVNSLVKMNNFIDR